MVYPLLLCADLYGHKVNLEIPFATFPSLAEIQQRAEIEFAEEAKAHRPRGYPELIVSAARLYLFVDTMNEWVELISCTQLHPYDQLYVFQLQSAWHLDMQQDLPPPKQIARLALGHQTQSMSPTKEVAFSPHITRDALLKTTQQQQQDQQQSSPVRRRDPYAPFEDKISAVFADMDRRRQHVLSREDLEKGFFACGVDYMDPNVREGLFAMLEGNPNGNHLTYNAFVSCMRRIPNTLDVLYLAGEKRSTVLEVEDQLRQQRIREEALLRQLQEVRQQKVVLECNRQRFWSEEKSLVEQKKRLETAQF